HRSRSLPGPPMCHHSGPSVRHPSRGYPARYRPALICCCAGRPRFSQRKTSGRHGASAMEYVKLGRTALEVSRICLGCMSYGAADSGNHAWSLGEEEARPFIKRALEGGINFFDTANRYSLGSSEEILGRAIKDFARRDEVVIATKVYGRMRPGPNGGGVSRKAIMSEIDASLRRLGMDYVDLYQIHRWDHETPIEDTADALHDVVKAGKARYIGASSMHAWQFGKALAVAERNG